MNNSNKKTLIITLTAVTLVLASLFGYMFYTNASNTPSVNPGPGPVIINNDDDYPEYRKLWDDNHKINSDYVGDLFFDSGLINVSFVQAKSVYKENGDMYTFYTEDGRLVTNPAGYTGNDVYIWTYWKTGEYDYNDNGGSVFMDYRNNIDDQNVIIYGHHFSVWNDETRKKAFTPLEQLMEKKNYNANQTVTMILENEIRKYELVYVYEFDARQDKFFNDFQYWRTDYNYDDYSGTRDSEYYANYIKAIESEKLYDTGKKLTTNDKTLTLQTCISGYTGELFEILVFRLAETINY